MSSSIPLQIAETVQTASINRAPSPSHDLNPSTAASSKQPVQFSSHTHSTTTSSSTSSSQYQGVEISKSELEEGIDINDITNDDVEEDEDGEGKGGDNIPYDVLRPVPRRGSFPPLPDLRFEQSYLASIRGAKDGWGVAYITIRDQVVFPLLQGTLWSLALHGWRFWNRSAQLSGSSVGAKVRRWWYRTNNWHVPGMRRRGNEKLAREVGDYYQYENSSD